MTSLIAGQPADPTLRMLKKVSKQVKTRSQSFLKNLKDNLKEKALDSFRDNWALDPMNSFFYPEVRVVFYPQVRVSYFFHYELSCFFFYPEVRLFPFLHRNEILYFRLSRCYTSLFYP